MFKKFIEFMITTVFNNKFASNNRIYKSKKTTELLKFITHICKVDLFTWIKTRHRLIVFTIACTA